MSEPPRVAVVVVAGVGDNPRTDAAQRIANGLVVCAEFEPPEERSEWYRVADRIQPVQRFATTSPAGTPVDLYEFWWADLSRFPAALRSFVAAFVGLFLIFPSIGRTALRGDGSITEDPQSPPAGKLPQRLDWHLLGFLSWLLAVPIVVLTATELMVVSAVTVAIALPDATSIIGAVLLALYGAVVAFVGLGLLLRYQNQSGRQPAFRLGIVSLAAAGAICGWRLLVRGTHGPSVVLALADTAAELVAYPLRLLWLAVLATALVALIVLGVRLIAAKGSADRRARTVSAVVTLGFGPLGIATLMAIFGATVGAVGEKLTHDVHWTAATGTPLCLAQPDDWTLSGCGPIAAWDFGSRLLAETIYSLACASAVALGAVLAFTVAAVVRGFVHGSANRDDRQAGRVTRMLGVLETPGACVFLLLAGVAATYVAAAAWLPFLPFIHPGEQHAFWGPTVAAVLGGGVTTLLIASRAIGLSPTSLAKDGKAPGALRAILDKPYDIATFLREPLGFRRAGHGFDRPMPRKLMLQRYRALLEYVQPRRYDRVVFVAHSQGTILTTTLLAEDGVALPPEVSLLTFGCPLRQLYLRRFPSQYGWVGRIREAAHRREFVRSVTNEWVNVAAAGDPIGRTVFSEPPEPWLQETRLQHDGSPPVSDLLLGEGGHTSYWTTPALYKELERLIEARDLPGANGRAREGGA